MRSKLQFHVLCYFVLTCKRGGIMDPRDDLIQILIPLYALPLLSETRINTSPPLCTIMGAWGQPCISGDLCTGCYLSEGLWLLLARRDTLPQPGNFCIRLGMGSTWAPGSPEHPSLFSSPGWETDFFLPEGDEGRACMHVHVCICACVCACACVWWASANFVPTWLGLCLTVMIPLSHSNFSGSLWSWEDFSQIFPATVINGGTT